jgi:hypothetical protein
MYNVLCADTELHTAPQLFCGSGKQSFSSMYDIKDQTYSLVVFIRFGMIHGSSISRDAKNRLRSHCRAVCLRV